jgi:hypothetical protein
VLQCLIFLLIFAYILSFFVHISDVLFEPCLQEAIKARELIQLFSTIQCLLLFLLSAEVSSRILIADSCYMFSYCLLLLCQCRKVKPNTLLYLHFFGVLSHYLAHHTYLQDTELRIIPSMMDARRKLEEIYVDSIQSLSSTSFQRYYSQLRASHHLRHAAENRRSMNEESYINTYSTEMCFLI